MIELSLDTIIGFIIEDLPRMIEQDDNTSRARLQIKDESEFIRVKIELEPNPLKGNYHDVSVVISGLDYRAKDKDHKVKMSIYSRQCMKDGKLNPDAPDKELEIETILPIEGNPFLEFPEIAKIEDELSSNVCSIWHDLLK